MLIWGGEVVEDARTVSEAEFIAFELRALRIGVWVSIALNVLLLSLLVRSG